MIIIFINRKKGYFGRIASVFLKFLDRAYDTKKRERQATTFYAEKSDAELEDIISKVINVLAILAGVYGILFALIISEKASLVFVSWSFVVWCGWVLAILIRIIYCCSILLGDYYQWDRKKKETILHGITKFTKHTIYLLIPTASFVPIFATLNTISIDKIKDIYPWDQETSLFLGILSVAIVTIFIYTFTLGIEKLIQFEYADIYMKVVIFLWLMGIVNISKSPLDPVTPNRIVGEYLNLTIPSILATIELIFVLIGMSMGITIVMELIMEILNKVGQQVSRTLHRLNVHNLNIRKKLRRYQ